MSNSLSPIEHGYLVLADLSGYTSFLTQTELDHAQEILSDLLETILKRFKTLLTIHRLEGDCVFGYATESQVIRGETLLELIEATYIDFRERMRNVRRHTTCTCRACQNIPMLDLKFTAHHGDFIFQNISGVRELAGPDVNLAHRLLKNHVSEYTGLHAYALFTQKCLEHMEVQPEGLIQGSESYEHLGDVTTFTLDLNARYRALIDERHVVVEPEEAAIAFTEDLEAAPPVVWSWINDPVKRALFTSNPHGLKFVPVIRPGGRSGAGAITHCVHGKNIAMREKVLDWKPFDYFTVEQDGGFLGVVQVTFKFDELETGGTRLSVRLKGQLPGWPAFLHKPAIRFFYGRLYNYRSIALKMKEVLSREMAGASIPEQGLEPSTS